jgi:hypothetical protein
MTNELNDLEFEARLRRSLERAAPQADPRLAERLLSRTAAESQRRGWSFFAGLGPALATAAVIIVAVIAGLALSGLPRNVGTDPTPSATPSVVPTPSASPSATPAPTPTPTPTEGATSAATPSASPDALRCTNEQMGFEVAYPADWHTNDEVEQEFADPVPACTYFGEVPMDIAPNAGLPSTVAIMFDVATQPSPDPAPAELISREETTVADRPATLSEWRFTEDGVFYEAGDRVAIYQVELADGSTLVASTNQQADGDYEEHRRVLEGMMESLALE